MKTWALIPLFLLMFIIPFLTSVAYGGESSGGRSGVSASPDIWVSGYIASWTLNMGSGTNGNSGNMPYQDVDIDAMTHVIMFAGGVNSDGSLYYNNLVSSRRKPFNDYVHSKGKPIILSLGGAGNTAFSTAMSAANRTNLVISLLACLRTEQYDGFDIDIEPVNTSDTANIRLFIRQLYDSLQTVNAYYDPSKRPILTAAIYNQRSLWARLAPYLDQINLMSYDFFGTWFGKSWHNNAPYGAPGDVDISNATMTTVQSKMQLYLDGGIPASKFGVGVDFDGYLWKGGLLADGSGNGVTAPRQLWSTPPAMQGGNEVPYWKIVRDWEQVYPGSVHYDNISKVPYIGVDNAGNASDYYMTYQDTSTVKEIIRLSRNANIGGVILWEVGAGYFGPGDFPIRAVRDPLLRAVKEEVFGGVIPPPPPQDVTPPTVDLTSPGAGDSVSGTVTIRAQASDNVGVSWVQFYVNGTALGSAVSTAPYQKNWTTTGLAGGSYNVRATASDAAGLKSSDSVTVVVYTLSVPGDTIVPTIFATAPAAEDTVSGTVQVSFTASDASGISEVKFIVDGVFTGAADASSPYSFGWNSTTVGDGPHTLGAEATDGAGLKTTASVQVYVKNAVPPPPPPDSTAVSVYGDGLVSPWVNASWGAVNTFTSPEQVFEGSYAIKSVQNAWGAISVHSGSWNTPVGLNTAGFDSLQFAVYPETTGLSLAVSLENDISGTFPAVTKSNIPADRWTLISIPVAALNPGGQLVHRLNIQNNTSQTRVYHVDRVVLGADTVAAGVTPLSAPSLSSPANGSIDQVLQPQLSWSPVGGATSYHLQVALDQLFSATVAEDQAVAGTSYQVGPLGSGTVYYWRVRANGSGTPSDYSQTFSFTTTEATVQALKYDRLFVDFGKVPIGTEKTDSVIIENNSPSQRKIIGVSTSSNVFDAIAGGLTIPAGGSQKLFIRYKPTKKSNDASRVISIIDSTNRADTVRVVGNGVNAPRQRNRGSIIFSNIPPEEDGSQDLYVANDGDLDLQIVSVTSTQEGITVSPSSATIAPHDSVPFAVTVSSHGRSGKISGLLVFSNNGLGAADSVLVEATLSGEGTGSSIPEHYSLSQNYPNPFNPTTTIGFGLPQDSRVIVRVYNVFGQEVKTVFDGSLGAGYGSVAWDGRNDAGETLASGVYFYRIEAFSSQGPGEPFIESRRMLLIK